MQQVWSQSVGVLNIPRTMMSTLDLSAPFRQALFMMPRKEFWKGLPDMVRMWKSEKFYEATMLDITERRTYGLMRDAKLAVVKGESEEMFMASDWVKELAPIRASDRAFTGFLHKLRADVFDTVVANAEMAVAGSSRDTKFLADLGKWVNRSTGRGTLLESMEQGSKLLNGVAFAPKLVAARIQILNPWTIGRYDPLVRKEAIKGLVGTLGMVGAMLGVMQAAGAKVNFDPTSSDFLKARFGNTRIDFLGGHQQAFRLLAQIVTGHVTSGTTGKTINLNEPGGYATRTSTVLHFLESKLSPVASLLLTLGSGEDFLGRPISVPNELWNRGTPLILGDLTDALEEYGLANGMPVAIVGLGFVGFSTQTYRAQVPKSVTGVDKQPNYGALMTLYRHLSGEQPVGALKYLTKEIVEDYTKDAVLIQVLGAAEASRVPGWTAMSKSEKRIEVNKAVERRMRPLRKLYGERLGKPDKDGKNVGELRVRTEKNWDALHEQVMKP
jgi:hypothetical protein